ncbi:YdcF family protein [Arthrobacter antioxidans]|uniref:YdcF family protein n=1 Tax=Arthrobacter antioxidans TaxID=2895818 RepID=UPI0020001B62|nr:ElyC/SanA/YdcF family protein [Arthrobacter antioxidans]
MTSDPPPPAPRRRLLRVLRTVGVLLAAVLTAWLVLAWTLFYDPPLRPAGRADAVVVLAGAAAERLPLGRELIDDGVADELVLSSTGLPGNAATDAVCAEENPDITCFVPDPLTTRGEARAVAALARDNGWDEIVVVTSTYHVTRASTNLAQCSEADITMAGSRPGLGASGWLGRFVEESTALVASFVRPACARPV